MWLENGWKAGFEHGIVEPELRDCVLGGGCLDDYVWYISTYRDAVPAPASQSRRWRRVRYQDPTRAPLSGRLRRGRVPYLSPFSGEAMPQRPRDRGRSAVGGTCSARLRDGPAHCWFAGPSENGPPPG